MKTLGVILVLLSWLSISVGIATSQDDFNSYSDSTISVSYPTSWDIFPLDEGIQYAFSPGTPRVNDLRDGDETIFILIIDQRELEEDNVLFSFSNNIDFTLGYYTALLVFSDRSSSDNRNPLVFSDFFSEETNYEQSRGVEFLIGETSYILYMSVISEDVFVAFTSVATSADKPQQLENLILVASSFEYIKTGND